MQRPSPRRHSRRESLASRVDHAAAEINPFLVVIAVGLVVLNLVCLAFLTPHLLVARAGRGSATASAGERSGPVPRLGGLQ